MIEHHAKCIEKSNKMLKMIDSAVELLHTKHRMGEGNKNVTKFFI
ncbi:hypothetical protein [Massiliimalia timonensis]